MKEIKIEQLSKENLEKLSSGLNFFHEKLLKQTEASMEAILMFDNEYQFTECNKGTLYLMMVTPVVIERRKKALDAEEKKE